MVAYVGRLIECHSHQPPSFEELAEMARRASDESGKAARRRDWARYRLIGKAAEDKDSEIWEKLSEFFLLHPDELCRKVAEEFIHRCPFPDVVQRFRDAAPRHLQLCALRLNGDVPAFLERRIKRHRR